MNTKPFLRVIELVFIFCTKNFVKLIHPIEIPSTICLFSFFSDLLRWIEAKIEELGNRDFANSLRGVQDQLGEFNSYRNFEKPPKFMEKGNLEVLLFTLQSEQRANNKTPYNPKEGKTISDINRAWELLEKAEHERELVSLI